MLARRGSALLLGCLALLPAGAARATVPEILVDPAPPPVEVLAPRAGSVLPGGGVALLAWEPRAGLDFAGRSFEEWEAFLSLDGGASYPVRLTPHLDLDLRRFAFQVPAVAADEARLLLRFGDERTERAYEVPGVFRIAPPAIAPPAGGLSALGRGESARPGEPGVVLWVEGSRRGGRRLQRTARQVAPGAAPVRWVAFRPSPQGLTPREPPRPEPPGVRVHAAVGERRRAASGPAVAARAGADPLLQSSRRNE